MDRRAFLTWVGVGWVASSLPIALAACSAKTTQSSQPTQPESSGSAEYQAVGSVAVLNKNGQLLNEKSPVGPVLIVRVSANNLLAVNPTCTHAGCTVAWLAEQKKFHCPCHGTEYSSDDKVIKGPARKPLKTYAVKIENDSVLVKQS